jgi:hypothetical protein
VHLCAGNIFTEDNEPSDGDQKAGRRSSSSTSPVAAAAASRARKERKEAGRKQEDIERTVLVRTITVLFLRRLLSRQTATKNKEAWQPLLG